MNRDTENMAEKAIQTTCAADNCSATTSDAEQPKRAKLDKRYVALCPLDGRYSEIEDRLAPFFSEYALVKARVFVEAEWLCFLLDNVESPILNTMLWNNSDNGIAEIEEIALNFCNEDFLRVKEIEEKTKHDVKACELFVAEKVEQLGFPELKSYVHFGLTSEDVTNLAYAKILNEFINKVYVSELTELIRDIGNMAIKYANTPMLAHTHGQAATPTTVGKELSVFVRRLTIECNNIDDSYIFGKLNGATGNYSALSVAFPEYDWEELARSFVEEYMCVNFNPVTTQIESHDFVASILDKVCHINNIIRDFDEDMWAYISRNYFKLKVVKTEVGSSTMPHKVNPIKFENSEGNIKIGNPICRALSDELTRSREQRDLSDSTVQRNLGLAFGYSLQAIQQARQGLSRSDVNEEALAADLENNWAVLAEPIQTVLRKYGVPDAYDKLKALTRGREITKDDIHAFIKSLDMLTEEDRERLLNLTPNAYIGYAAKIAVDWTTEYLYSLS